MLSVSLGSDYFKVLVNVFQTVLLSEENEDLKNFFMIVPALCLSWIDASLQAKDNMFKATRGITKEMYFTDDGFAMGIAYCLAITKQTRKFEALHWVDSIRGKIRADAAQLEAQQAARLVDL
jgi:WASH complex subunit 7